MLGIFCSALQHSSPRTLLLLFLRLGPKGREESERTAAMDLLLEHLSVCSCLRMGIESYRMAHMTHVKFVCLRKDGPNARETSRSKPARFGCGGDFLFMYDDNLLRNDMIKVLERGTETLVFHALCVMLSKRGL